MLRWAAVAFVLLLPAAAAQDVPSVATPTTLFLHLYGYQDMPMTTHEPEPSFERDVSLGIATSSLSCFPRTTGASLQQDYHTYRGIGLLGRVEYVSVDEPRVRFDGYPGSGLYADVQLAGDQMILHWYWSTSATGPLGAGPEAPLVVPDVVVEATLRAGQQVSVDDVAYDSGPVLAHGKTAPALLAAEQSSGVEHLMVGGRHVYHFEVPLAVAAPVMPAALGYNLRVDTYVLREDCPADGYLMPNVLAAHTSPGNRPRLELVVANPLAVEMVEARPYGDQLILAANVSSPWGAHDIAAIDLAVTGPSAARSIDPVPFLGQAEHCHCPPAPQQVAWLWDVGLDDPKAGDYVAHITLTNLQGATLVVERPFTVSGDREAPALPVLALLGVLALAAVAARRP